MVFIPARLPAVAAPVAGSSIGASRIAARNTYSSRKSLELANARESVQTRRVAQADVTTHEWMNQLPLLVGR